MADFPSWKELFDLAKNTILAGNAGITQDAVERPGTHVNILTAMMASVADEVIHQAAVAMQRAIPSLASGDYLDRLAWDWYGLTRNPATPATATVTFHRTTTDVYTMPAGTRVTNADGSVGFLTDTDTIFAADVTDADVAVTCEQAGTIGNLEANQITVLQTPQPGQSFTITASTEATGGEDEETDKNLRWRIRNFWASVQRGTLAALEYGAKQVSGITLAHAYETQDSEDCYTVHLIVADSSGRANSSQVAAVQTEIDHWRACGVKVNVVGGQVQYVDVAVTLTLEAGFDPTVAIETVRSNIVNTINRKGINETLHVSSIQMAALIYGKGGTAPDLGVRDATVTAPATDIVPPDGYILRTTPDRVSIS